MKVIHLSSADNKGGGARSAYRLHEELNKKNVDSKMYVRNKYSSDDKVIKYEHFSSPLSKFKQRIRKRLETRGQGYISRQNTIYNGFAPATSPLGKSPYNQLPSADIITLNWVAGFWDYRLLNAMPNKCKKIIWRLSDMHPFTGGCFYDASCGKYKTGCGSCPCLDSKKEKDLSRASIGLKRSVIESLPKGFLHIVAQSKWIAEEIKSSQVFNGIEVTHIANGIDESEFKPLDRMQSRKSLGIAEDEKVIMFIAQSLGNPRKGAAYFKEAMEVVGRQIANITVLAVGADGFGPIDGVKINEKKDVSSAEELSACYSAADVYVITSLQDNLPNTVLEAMSCGTPVVGFEVGGVPDLVENEKSGYLIETKNVQQLASQVIKLIEQPDLCVEMGSNARKRVLEHYTISGQTYKYINLYQSLLKE
ncbi:MAG: glycosyltransferase [Bacteroidia bacterium]